MLPVSARVLFGLAICGAAQIRLLFMLWMELQDHSMFPDRMPFIKTGQGANPTTTDIRDALSDATPFAAIRTGAAMASNALRFIRAGNGMICPAIAQAFRSSK